MAIDLDFDAIAQRGDVRAYRVAHLASVIIKAEAAEGRTNRAYISTLEMLVEENERLREEVEGG